MLQLLTVFSLAFYPLTFYFMHFGKMSPSTEQSGNKIPTAYSTDLTTKSKVHQQSCCLLPLQHFS